LNLSLQLGGSKILLHVIKGVKRGRLIQNVSVKKLTIQSEHTPNGCTCCIIEGLSQRMRSWTMVTWGTDVALMGGSWQRRYTKEARFVQKPADCEASRFLNASFHMYHAATPQQRGVQSRGQGGVQRQRR
jgi:hypothetical protein